MTRGFEQVFASEKTSAPVGRNPVDSVSISVPGVPGRAGGAPGRWLPLIVCLLVVGGTVSWRQRVYFDGGLDPVVVAKAAVSALALLLSAHIRINCPRPNPIGVRSSVFLALFVLLSTFGGWAAGDGLASLIVAVRVVLVGAAAYLLLRSLSPDVLLRSLFTAMALVGGLAVLTGVLALGSTGGRLQGGLPPLSPNEIALLCGAPAFALIWRNLVHRGHRRDLFLIALLLGGVLASESRTGLAALLLAIAVMVLQARRMPVGAAALVVAALSGIVYALLTTDVLSAYFERSDEGSVATLNSRTIAWTAALELPQTAYAWWLGGGLALKRIPVAGQYWNDQGLDSSWVSAWVQGGMICVLLLLAWTLSAFVAGRRTPRPYRMLITGVLLFQIIRSFLESGLIDGTPSFFLFMVMSTLAESGSRGTLIAAAATWTTAATPPDQKVRPLPSDLLPGARPDSVARSAGSGWATAATADCTAGAGEPSAVVAAVPSRPRLADS